MIHATGYLITPDIMTRPSAQARGWGGGLRRGGAEVLLHALASGGRFAAKRVKIMRLGCRKSFNGVSSGCTFGHLSRSCFVRPPRARAEKLPALVGIFGTALAHFGCYWFLGTRLLIVGSAGRNDAGCPTVLVYPRRVPLSGER